MLIMQPSKIDFIFPSYTRPRVQSRASARTFSPEVASSASLSNSYTGSTGTSFTHGVCTGTYTACLAGAVTQLASTRAATSGIVFGIICRALCGYIAHSPAADSLTAWPRRRYWRARPRSAPAPRRTSCP